MGSSATTVTLIEYSTTLIHLSNMMEAQEGFKEVVVQKQDVSRLLGNLDVRKAMGPDGVSGWTVKECRDQLIRTSNLGSDHKLSRRRECHKSGRGPT